MYLGTRQWAISLERYIESPPIGFESQAKKCSYYSGESWRSEVFGRMNKVRLELQNVLLSHVPQAALMRKGWPRLKRPLQQSRLGVMQACDQMVAVQTSSWDSETSVSKS